MASAVPPCLLFCFVLLVSPHLGCSYYSSYTHGGKHFVVLSNEDPKQPSQTCSDIHSGRSSRDGLPLVHRLSPCSPLSNAHDQNQERPSAETVLHRDALRLRSLFGVDSSASSAPAPAPVSPGVTVSIPDRGDPIRALPGAFEYHVIAGFGTPVQKFAVGFDTATGGATLLQCKPCATYPEPCDNSFDPSRSSSIVQVPCGSPDCPFSGCSGPSCTLSVSVNSTLVGNATFVTDTLTLSPSTTVENFRFACLEAGLQTRDSSSGILDLSRNSHSLASRAPSSPDTVAFSYCLPSSANYVGFLSIGATRPELSGHNVSGYTPLRSNPARGNLYFVELSGLGVGGPDLPIPPSNLAGDSLLDLHSTFTYLKPEVYAVLRDNFRKWMSQYRVAPPRGQLDTCYDFTGLKILVTPVITLKFDGGASVDLLIEEMMYFPNQNVFSIGCLAFVAAPANARVVSVIGTLAQASTEVVYDVRVGKLGFVPYRC